MSLEGLEKYLSCDFGSLFCVFFESMNTTFGLLRNWFEIRVSPKIKALKLLYRMLGFVDQTFFYYENVVIIIVNIKG